MVERESIDFIPAVLEDMNVPLDAANDENHQKEGKSGKVAKKFLKSILKFLLFAVIVVVLIFTIGVYHLYSCLSIAAEERLFELTGNLLDQFTTEMSLEMERFTTVTESNSFSVQEFSTSELDALKETVISFWDSIQSGASPKDLVLTAAGVNGFFAASEYFRVDAFTEMKQHEYKMSFSLPTDFLPGGKGRFFNGYTTIKWDPQTQRLTVKVDSHHLEENIGQFADLEFEVTTTEDSEIPLSLQILKGNAFGYEIPVEFIGEHYNLLEQFCDGYRHDDDCKQTRNFLRSLAGVSIEDGQVVVHMDPEL